MLGWVLLSCAATSVQAQIDTPSPGKQTLDQQTPQVDLPDASSSPISSVGVSSSNELGVSVGAFTLYPALEFDLERRAFNREHIQRL